MSTSKWMKKLTNDFGKIAGEMPSPRDSVVAMPSPSFNWAVGNGGIAEGKILCYYGPESGGKSLCAALTVIELQKKYPDSIHIWFDAEFSFNKDWFRKLGGDLDRLIIRQSNDPTKIFDYIYGEMYEMLQEGCPIKSLVLDSVKSIRFPKDIKKVSTDVNMGGSGAAYLGSALKGVVPVIREFNVTTIFIQQVYEEMDQYKKMRNPYIVPDGRALKHACDYMLQVEKLETKDGVVEDGKNIHGGNSQVGHKVRIKVKKNRVGAPYRTAEFTLVYTHGIVDQGGELFELAKSLGVIYHPTNPETGKENPQMWCFADHSVRGEANMKQWVIDNPAIHSKILDACMMVSDDASNARNESLGESMDINLEVDVNDL